MFIMLRFSHFSQTIRSSKISSYVTNRAIANAISTALCALAVVIRPVSRLGGHGSAVFLILTIKAIVFYVQRDLALQLELTILNLAGALLGIGLSSLGLYLHLIATNSAASRTIVASFLVVISFLAGWTKSRLPRLTLASRILCFVAIFMLTDYVQINSIEDVAALAEEFIWICVGAAVFSLLASILLLPWTSTLFAEETSSVFATLRNTLASTLNDAFAISQPNERTASVIRIRQEELLKKSAALNVAYTYAAFELRLGRVSVKVIRPLIAIVEHIRRELSWGMTFEESPFLRAENRIVKIFQPLATELGEALVLSMSTVENIIVLAFQKSAARQDLALDMLTLAKANDRLIEARDAAREALQRFSDESDMEQRQAIEQRDLDSALFSPETFDLCLFIISLTQMAHEMQKAIDIAIRVSATYQNSRLRLWYPRFSLAWLGASPRTFMEEDDSPFSNSDTPPPTTSLTEEEARRGLADAQIMHMAVGELPSSPASLLERSKKHLSRIRTISLSNLWNVNTVLRFRIRLSRVLNSIKNSSHLQHAFKNAAGIALLGIPAFLPGHSSLYYVTHMHAPWMIISYLYVLETNTGATWRVGYLRVLGTLFGAVYAYITWLIVHANPYGLVVLVTLGEVIFGWFIMHSSVPPIGTVALITIPPIAFQQYLNTDSYGSVLVLACFRVAMIIAGIIGALMMNSLVFPRHCRILFLSQTSRTIGLLSNLYLSLCRDIVQNPAAHMTHNHEKRTITKAEIQIRNSLMNLTTLLKNMNDELSLMPKPMRSYQQVVQALQKALDQMTGLRKIRENIPRRETVAAVFQERRELISCVCVSLFACEQVFMARQPLPQFLPSARQALQILEDQVEERIQEARKKDPFAMGYSLVYSFAETEAMRNFVDTVHELLDICRDLFGTASWMVTPSALPSRDVSLYEEGNGRGHITKKVSWGWDGARDIV